MGVTTPSRFRFNEVYTCNDFNLTTRNNWFGIFLASNYQLSTST